MLKKLFLIIFTFSFWSNNVIAIEPDIFVQSTVNRASKLLSENLTKEEKIQELEKIAKDTVDIKGIGFYTLGSFRKSLNETDKIEYSQLFEVYFLKSFSSRLAEYTNPEIDVFKKGVKVASVGAIGYSDYPTYLELERKGKKPKGYAKQRRKLYKIRHNKNRNKRGTNSWYADKLLW